MYEVGKVYKLLGQSLQCEEKSDQHFNEEQTRSTAITSSPLNGTINVILKLSDKKKIKTLNFYVVSVKIKKLRNNGAMFGNLVK